MTIKAHSDASVDLAVGAVWPIEVRVTDADGCPAADTVVVTVTLPNGSTATPTVEEVATGAYRAEQTVSAAGRYIARAVGALGAADFTAFVTATVPAADMPDIVDLDAYLGTNSFTDEVLQDALDAEAAAQRKACKVPATYPADLRQALLRRCARNLAMRRIPMAVQQGDADTGALVPPGRDPEVRRFEAPYRKLPVG